MKLPLRFGIPLLLALLAGLAVVDGQERNVLLVVAMGVALWSALSIPRPPPKETEDTLEQRLEMADGEEMELNGGKSSPEEKKGSGTRSRGWEGRGEPGQKRNGGPRLKPGD